MNIPVDIEWNLHILRVVIDDGGPEFHVDDVFNWGVIGFWSDAVLSKAVERTKVAVPLDNNYYRVNAEIVYVSHDPEQSACILDFGIKAISESGGLLGVPLALGIQVGDYVTGEVRLELPLCTAVHPYNLVQQWRVNRISADSTDFLSYPGDISKVHYLDVFGTDSAEAGSYVLCCSELNP